MMHNLSMLVNLIGQNKLMLSIRDSIWLACILGGIAFTTWMISSRVTALESKIKDFDMLRIDARLAVIEEQVKQINKKLN